jgi:ankyrin repeat protein
MSKPYISKCFAIAFMATLIFTHACRQPQPQPYSENITYESFTEAGPHFKLVFFHYGKFGVCWFQGLSGCGVPGAQMLNLSEEAVRDLIQGFHDIDFFNMPRVPKASSDPYGVTLTYRDNLRIHEVADYRRDNPKLVQLEDRIRKTVDIEKFISPTVEVYRQLVASGGWAWNLDTADEYSQTALTYAARNQDLESVQFLLKQGAAVTAGALEAAAAGKKSEIFFLMLRGTTPDLKVSAHLRLLISAAAGNVEVARTLIKGGVDLNARDREGWTPLIAAAGYGNVDMARLLIEAGADVNLREADGSRTPLMFAIENGHLAVTRLLLEKGAQANLSDYAGRTAMHRAAWKGNTGFVTILAQHGAEVNARDKQGRTALMEAMSLCAEWNIKALLDVGADTALTDKSGKTALQQSASSDHDPKCDRCRKLLENAIKKLSAEGAEKKTEDAEKISQKSIGALRPQLLSPRPLR